MQLDDMILVSVDDHVVEPPGMWNDRVPKKYADEEPWIREKFEAELAQRGLTSDIPEDAYRIRDYEWDYGDDDD